MDVKRGTALKGFAAAGMVVCFWSGFNIVSRLAGKSDLSPFDLAALRFTVAGVLLSPFFIRALQRIDVRQFGRYLVVTLFGGLGYALPVYTGFSFAPAAHAGVLVNGGIPFATALLAWVVLAHRPSARSLLALLIALTGILMMAWQSLLHSESGGQQWLGDVAFLGAALSWAIAGLLMRHWQLPPLDTTAMMVGLSALLYVPAYFFWLPHALQEVALPTLLFQGFYQGVVAATLGGMFYNYAVHSIGPQKASLMLALVPGVTAVLAFPLLGEVLTPITIAGVVLVTVGAVLGAIQRT